MGKRLGLKVLAISVALVMVASSVAMYGHSGTEAEKGISEGGGGKGVISLMPPPFIKVAGAAEVAGGGGAAQRAGTSFLEEEAGISAYTNVGEAIDIAKAKTAFRTVEYETGEYIIGSVPLPDYAETEDVHAYVHKDGWVVTYYLKEEPAAKILDWNSYEGATITSTKLENAIMEICDAAGVLFIEPKYYHFQYQNANNLMIAADAQFGDGTDTFKIKIPSDLVVYERSWSHRAYLTYSSSHNYRSVMCIDGSELSCLYVSNEVGARKYGQLTPTELKPDVFHTMSIENNKVYVHGFNAIVLIYRET